MREIAVPAPIPERVQRLVESAGEDLETVIYYEHPFTVRGIIAVVSAGAGPYPDVLARIYRALPQIKVHCFRRWELFHLALPGCWPPLLDDQPHLAHCVKHRSVLLHGRDCRGEIPLPARPEVFLRAHVRDCRQYLRVHFLKLLMAREHRKAIDNAVLEARRLLSTALLGDGGWQIDPADVVERFAQHHSVEASRVARKLESLAERQPDGPDAEAMAREAFWLFERLTRLMGDAP